MKRARRAILLAVSALLSGAAPGRTQPCLPVDEYAEGLRDFAVRLAEDSGDV